MRGWLELSQTVSWQKNFITVSHVISYCHRGPSASESSTTGSSAAMEKTKSLSYGERLKRSLDWIGKQNHQASTGSRLRVEISLLGGLRCQLMLGCGFGLDQLWAYGRDGQCSWAFCFSADVQIKWNFSKNLDWIRQPGHQEEEWEGLKKKLAK
jgi:hypothetical protein